MMLKNKGKNSNRNKKNKMDQQQRIRVWVVASTGLELTKVERPESNNTIRISAYCNPDRSGEKLPKTFKRYIICI
jgi:hypothetical protein